MDTQKIRTSKHTSQRGIYKKVRLKIMGTLGHQIDTTAIPTQPLVDDTEKPTVKLSIPLSEADTQSEIKATPQPKKMVILATEHTEYRKPSFDKRTLPIQHKQAQQAVRGRGCVATTLMVICSLLVILFAGGSYASFGYYQSQLPVLKHLVQQHIDQSTRIYDRTGQLLFILYNNNTGGRHLNVSYLQIPGVLQDAQIAAEDKTFWTNSGIDIQATLRSAIIDLAAGRPETGASTITQQVIKKLSNNTELSGQRKLSEAALAIGLTQTYPKWKILEMYFNIAPYNAQDVGVEAAIEGYFGLKPQCDTSTHCIPATSFLDRDLTKCLHPDDVSSCQEDPLLALARASILASLPQNPVNLDPALAPGNLDSLLKRQDYVLNQMLGQHMQINLGLGDQAHNVAIITPKIIRQVEALSKQIKFADFRNNMKAPHFVWQIISQLANALGSSQDIDPNTGMSVSGADLLMTGGFNIRTTLDLNLEQYVEQATKDDLNQPQLQKLTGRVLTLSKDNNINDAATVVMDAHNGEVLAMNGSSDWNNSDPRVGGEYNAALTPRQAASTFKPIVMASAFEMGWYPGIVLTDQKTYFPIGAPLDQTVASYNTYIPTDDNDTYSYQSVNLDFALSNSLNVPAVKAYMYAGKQNVSTMAQRLGITTIQPKQVNPTIALGTASVSLLQMVGAYQTFANQGVRVPPHLILDIWDNYGHDYYHYNPTQSDGTQVLSPQIAYMVTSLLTDEPARSYAFGGDHDLSMWDWTLSDGTHPEVAAKTGTSENFVDNWTIGYTPDIVVGVWAGNANGAPGTNSLGLTGAAPLWHSIIEYASGHCNVANDHIPCPPSDFTYSNDHFSIPPGLILHQVNTFNGLEGSGFSSWMLDGQQPRQSGF